MGGEGRGGKGKGGEGECCEVQKILKTDPASLRTQCGHSEQIRRGYRRILWVSHRVAYRTNASRGLSTIAEFLV